MDSAWDIKAPNFIGNAENATKVNVISTNPSSITAYNVNFTLGEAGNTNIRANNGITYGASNGTTSSTGESFIILGNSTSYGTSGNKRGRVRLYGAFNQAVDIMPPNTNTYRAINIPDLAGTFVVKQSANITTETNGWYVVDMGAYTLYFKTGQIPSQTYNMNGWGNLSGSWRNLPSGITFDSAKMVFSGNAQCQDSAILYNLAVGNGGTAVGICYNNKYGQDLTKVGYYNFSLIVFP